MQDCQTLIPPAFSELFAQPSHRARALDWAYVASRYELCEDMAQLLTEHARQVLVKLGIAESDVLDKILQGLWAEEARLSEHEAVWVVCRLAELLGWPVPQAQIASLGEETATWLQKQLAAA